MKNKKSFIYVSLLFMALQPSAYANEETVPNSNNYVECKHYNLLLDKLLTYNLISESDHEATSCIEPYEDKLVEWSGSWRSGSSINKNDDTNYEFYLPENEVSTMVDFIETTKATLLAGNKVYVSFRLTNTRNFSNEVEILSVSDMSYTPYGRGADRPTVEFTTNELIVDSRSNWPGNRSVTGFELHTAQ